MTKITLTQTADPNDVAFIVTLPEAVLWRRLEELQVETASDDQHQAAALLMLDAPGLRAVLAALPGAREKFAAQERERTESFKAWQGQVQRHFRDQLQARTLEAVDRFAAEQPQPQPVHVTFSLPPDSIKVAAPNVTVQAPPLRVVAELPATETTTEIEHDKDKRITRTRAVTRALEH